nr:unnamed protein product [Digitaria exilis]
MWNGRSHFSGGQNNGNDDQQDGYGSGGQQQQQYESTGGKKPRGSSRLKKSSAAVGKKDAADADADYPKSYAAEVHVYGAPPGYESNESNGKEKEQRRRGGGFFGPAFHAVGHFFDCKFGLNNRDRD